jgi:proline iminopeptidase
VSLAALHGTQRSDAAFAVRDELARIATPTLVLAGRHDFICAPAQPEIIHRGIGGSALTWFEHSGHFPWLEEPEGFFGEVADFLSSRRR